MIIGVSGKKQHGKDSVTRMFNWIIASKKLGKDQLPPMRDYVLDHSIEIDVGWKFKKYADKLKDIICMLTGCTREQLEDDEFKNSFMPIEWNKRVRGSYASCGNKFIQDEAFYTKYNPKFYCIDFDKPDSIEVNKYNKAKQSHDNGYLSEFNGMMFYDRRYCIQERRTYRDALQFIGTDLFRKQFNDNTWVDATMADYKGVIISNELSEDIIKFPDWFISDMRFPNEVKAIKDRDGLIIRVNRPSVVSTDNHESETALDNFKDFDLVITNNYDLDDMYRILLSFIEKNILL